MVPIEKALSFCSLICYKYKLQLLLSSGKKDYDKIQIQIKNIFKEEIFV